MPSKHTPLPNPSDTKELIQPGLLILDASYLPGVLLHLDFIFYDIESIRGYNVVLDVVCTSTTYGYAFSTRAK